MKLDITRIEQKGAVLYLGWLPDEFVDLCYIDPPFFSNKTYEVIFGDGRKSALLKTDGRGDRK